MIVVEDFADLHILIAPGQASSTSVIIEQGVRFWVLPVLVEIKILEGRLEIHVGGLVLGHDEERLRFVALLQPVECEIGNDIGYITLVLHTLAVTNHRRVIVLPLVGKDFPVVKTCGIAYQMPFSD